MVIGISIVILNRDYSYILIWIETVKLNILYIAALDVNVVRENLKSSYKYL